MEICSSHRCAVTQHKCIAAMFRARCNYHSSVLLCKTGSHQAVCHSRFTYGDLLFMQVCKDIAPMHCSSVQGKMQSPLFSAALQHLLTPGSLALQIHLWRFSLCSDAAQMNCSYVQGKMQLPQFSKTGSHQALCHSRFTYGDLLYIQVCSDIAPMHCSFVQGKMQSPLFSAALQNLLTTGRVSQQIHLWRSALHTGVQ